MVGWRCSTPSRQCTAGSCSWQKCHRIRAVQLFMVKTECWKIERLHRQPRNAFLQTRDECTLVQSIHADMSYCDSWSHALAASCVCTVRIVEMQEFSQTTMRHLLMPHRLARRSSAYADTSSHHIICYCLLALSGNTSSKRTRQSKLACTL